MHKISWNKKKSKVIELGGQFIQTDFDLKKLRFLDNDSVYVLDWILAFQVERKLGFQHGSICNTQTQKTMNFIAAFFQLQSAREAPIYWNQT